ncbi:unnamed protein product [Nezara viridula]|uniref:tRNA(Phe) (4-demethylwyosine(37)-C(7)) aminocarboxypropyltransferase n=1 Tax=Nezara viridula TaxID=85310 RepID=A0A9P0MTM4_NEZVI|nr:unnamed protein product [Nezara viridula]
MTKPNSVKSKLHDEITTYMKNNTKWFEYLINELPSSWENYNGFIVFSFPSFMSHIWLEAGPGIWQVICKSLKAHSIAIKGRIQNDSFRTPQACLVYGSSPVITYIDNKIRYSWNVEKTMFSAGNVTERHRIASLKCDNEVIVDLFAGIGYFTLPFLVHANAKLVHACEWNPDAIDSLRRNLRLNKVEDKCKIYEGDNRKISPKFVANRVNIGLIPSSEKFWKTACEALLPSGGILYVHQNITSRISTNHGNCDFCKMLKERIKCDLGGKIEVPKIKLSKNTDFEIEFGTDSCITWKHSEWFVFSIHLSHILIGILENIHNYKWLVSVDDVVKVKSYAPHIDHLVYTVSCKPQN